MNVNGRWELGRIRLDGIADGTPLTKLNGAAFGGPNELGFPGDAGKHVCEGAPTIHDGIAYAPACPSLGDYDATGTVVKFDTPVKSVSLKCGTNELRPGGFACDLDAFDAAGHLLPNNTGTTTSVAITDSTRPGKTLTVAADGKKTISFVRLSFYGIWKPPVQLTFDDLSYAGA